MKKVLFTLGLVALAGVMVAVIYPFILPMSMLTL